MMGLPSRVPKSCCWTPDFCFEEVCAESNPPMAVMKTRAHARISRLGIMAKSVLRAVLFVMCASVVPLQEAPFESNSYRQASHIRLSRRSIHSTECDDAIAH